MPLVNKLQLMSAVQHAAAKALVDWQDHLTRAEQVIVFGSFAAGLQTATSDVDVLCVGSGRSVLTPSLHLLWMPASRLEEHLRSGSELACHVATYGVWLKGVRTFPTTVCPSDDTIRNRHDSVYARLAALTEHWSRLEPEYRAKHASKIRRDLQRWSLLKSGRASMPRPALDADWAQRARRRECLDAWLGERAMAESYPDRVIRLVSGHG